MFNTHVVGACGFSERSDCITIGTIQVTVRGNQWLEGIVSRILQGYPDSTKCGGNTSRVGEDFQVGSESDVKALLG